MRPFINPTPVAHDQSRQRKTFNTETFQKVKNKPTTGGNLDHSLVKNKPTTRGNLDHSLMKNKPTTGGNLDFSLMKNKPTRGGNLDLSLNIISFAFKTFNTNTRAGENPRLRQEFSPICYRILPNVRLGFYQAMKARRTCFIY